jgi:hypothetical protein
MTDMHYELFNEVREQLATASTDEDRALEAAMAEYMAQAPKRIHRMMEMSHRFAADAIATEEPRLMYAAMAVACYAGMIPMERGSTPSDLMNMAEQAYAEGRAVADQILAAQVDAALDAFNG